MIIFDITTIQRGIIIYYNTTTGGINASSFNNEYIEGNYYGPTTDDALLKIHHYITLGSSKNTSYFAKLDRQRKWEYLNRLVKKYNLGRLVLQIEDDKTMVVETYVKKTNQV